MNRVSRINRGLRARRHGDQASIYRTTHRDGSVSVNVWGNMARIRVPLRELLDAMGITIDDCLRAFDARSES
jgi:hypothetical protein